MHFTGALDKSNNMLTFKYFVSTRELTYLDPGLLEHTSRHPSVVNPAPGVLVDLRRRYKTFIPSETHFRAFRPISRRQKSTRAHCH